LFNTDNFAHRAGPKQLSMHNSSKITNRKNGVPVDDKDTEDCESDWFSAQTIQKHVELHTNTVYIEISFMQGNHNITQSKTDWK